MILPPAETEQLADWHDHAPNRALIVAVCISACAVMMAVGGLVWWLI